GSLVGPDAFAGSLTRTPGETLGAYSILQGTLALSSNYALVYVGANLTIVLAPPVAQDKAFTAVVKPPHGDNDKDDGDDWRGGVHGDDEWENAVNEGRATRIILTATDADSTMLSFAIVTPPSRGTVSRIRHLACTPDGHGGTLCTADVIYMAAAGSI